MASHIAENTGQRSNFDRIMIGNRDVVLSAFAGGQAQMAAALPRDRIAQISQRPRQFSAGKISWQFHFTQATESKASHGDDRSEEHTSELQSPCNLVCRLLLEKKKTKHISCRY